MPALDVIVPDRWCAFRRVFGCACIMQPTSGSRECGFETRRDLPDGIFRGLRKNLVDAARPSDDDCSRAMAFVAWNVERGNWQILVLSNSGAAMKNYWYCLSCLPSQATIPRRPRLSASGSTSCISAMRSNSRSIVTRPGTSRSSFASSRFMCGPTRSGPRSKTDWCSSGRAGGAPRRSGRSFRRRRANAGFTHEFHSLSMGTLYVDRRGTHDATWTPRGPGIELVPIEDAPAPAAYGRAAAGQMRALAREFSATTRDVSDNRYTLRLLSQPLFRYESTDPEVLDGALFAFVTSAGTDPESLLVIEARKPKGGATPVWHRALGRFTDLELSVHYKGNEVFSRRLSAAIRSRCTPSSNTGSTPTAWLPTRRSRPQGTKP